MAMFEKSPEIFKRLNEFEIVYEKRQLSSHFKWLC